MDSTGKIYTPGEPDEYWSKNERRAHERLPCWGSYWITILPDGLKVLGYPLNLSLGGCYFETDAEIPAQIGTSIEVHLRVDSHSLLLPGTICHIEEKTRAGIRFTDFSSRKKEQIQRLVAELTECERKRMAGIQIPCKESKDA